MTQTTFRFLDALHWYVAGITCNCRAVFDFIRDFDSPIEVTPLDCAIVIAQEMANHYEPSVKAIKELIRELSPEDIYNEAIGLNGSNVSIKASANKFLKLLENSSVQSVDDLKVYIN